MRIAIDLTALADNFSGIERYACEMAKAILRLNTSDFFILLFKDNIFPDFYEWQRDDRVEMCVIASHGSSKLVFTQIMLPAKLRKIKADAYLFMAFPAPALFFSDKAVSTIHDLCCWDCPETMTVKSRMLWRVLDAKAAHGRLVNTISNFSKSRIMERYRIPSKRITVCYCGISSEFEERTWRSEANVENVRVKYELPERYILTLSTIEPRKNVPELIEAWRLYRRIDAYPADLVLAGRKGWKTDSLLEGLSSDELSHVHVTGFVEDNDLPAVYGMAESFVFPSIYEGFGLPPVEASKAGTRVICSDIPCLREVVGNAAEYYSLGNVEQLSQLLSKPRPCVSSSLPTDYIWKEPAKIILQTITAYIGSND